MGMYIEIEGAYPCPVCGKPIVGWQSKDLSYDSYPIALLLNRYRLNKKMSGEIHTGCKTCGAVAYSYRRGKLTPLQH